MELTRRGAVALFGQARRTDGRREASSTRVAHVRERHEREAGERGDAGESEVLHGGTMA
jgi:hypothetical protein